MLFVTLFVKLFAWMFKRTRDVSEDAYKSVKHSDSFSEAYQNFSSDKFAKSRLSMPEEIIALMAKIASSDGKISDLEIEYMSDTIKTMVAGMEKAGVPSGIVERTKKRLFAIANTAKKDDKPIQFYTESLKKSAPDVKMGAFMQIIAFSNLDGIVDETLVLLQHIGHEFGFDKEEVDQIIERVMGMTQNGGYNPQKNPYEELGVKEEDDFSHIKKQYRRLVRKNHPDYMHGQGMDEAEIQKSTERMQEINAAFEEIKRRKGES